jgi:hypothetical protein
VRRLRRLLLGALAFVVVLLGGCAIVPVANFEPDRYTSAQIRSVQKDESTKQTISEKLGEPDSKKDAERIWFYVWEVKHGSLVLICLSPFGCGDPVSTVSDKIYLETRVMVLEFDSNEVLRDKVFAHRLKGAGERYCTDDELCLDNPVYAVTVSGRAKERAGRAEAQSSQCLLTIWPDKDWSLSSGASSGPHAAGLPLMIDGVLSYYWPQIAVEAFAVTPLPGGVHRVEVGAEAASFKCEPGDRIFFAIGVTKPEGDWPPAVLRPVDSAAAQSLIANMPQLLLP